MQVFTSSHLAKQWAKGTASGPVSVLINHFGKVTKSTIGLMKLRREFTFEGFAGRINPKNFNFSPKLTAMVGAIIGFDYGVRDARGGRLTSLSITSDGYVLCTTASDGGGAFLGSAEELDDNLALWREELSSADRAKFERLFSANVKDWRRY